MTWAAALTLSADQLDLLRRHGDERSAAAGEVLFEVGDETYPFIALLDGEVAVTDPAGGEIARHGPREFIGEVGLLSGQTVFLTATATGATRYLAVDRNVLRDLLFEDGPLSDLILTAFIARREELQARSGIGVEVIGPSESEATGATCAALRRSGVVFSWRDPAADDEAATLIEALGEEELPLVRLPGGTDLRSPTAGEIARALGVGLELGSREEVDLLIVGGGPGGLGAAVYGASEGLDTLVVEATALGGQAGTSRRIENYLGFPAGIAGAQLTARAITQARKFGARTATPYRAVALECAGDRHVVRLEGGEEVSARAVVLATGAEYRRLPVEGIESYEGHSVFYAAGPPEAVRCGGSRVGVIGGGNSAAQAAVWLARGGALVTLLHRRADLRETMSDYLLDELDRAGVEVRDRSEVAQLHGEDGDLRSVALKDGAELALGYLFCFLGASPCTDWLGDAVGRDADGFVLTGEDAGADGLLETSVPGVFAAGDARSGSVKRCATAVGEGAMVVRFVHERLTGVPA